MNPSRQERYSIYFFTFATSMFWFSLYAYIAELSTYASSLGASYKMIGFITGSYGLTQLLLRIPLGIFSDILGKRKIFILLGLFVASISALVSFFSRHNCPSLPQDHLPEFLRLLGLFLQSLTPVIIRKKRLQKHMALPSYGLSLYFIEACPLEC